MVRTGKIEIIATVEKNVKAAQCHIFLSNEIFISFDYSSFLSRTFFYFLFSFYESDARRVNKHEATTENKTDGIFPFQGKEEEANLPAEHRRGSDVLACLLKAMTKIFKSVFFI